MAEQAQVELKLPLGSVNVILETLNRAPVNGVPVMEVAALIQSISEQTKAQLAAAEQAAQAVETPARKLGRPPGKKTTVAEAVQDADPILE
jgi:hypothetical protein